MLSKFAQGCLIVSVCLASFIPSALAQSRKKEIELPSNPAQWINSPPLSSEMLAGKSIVFWFFEEQCPKCAGKWPDLLSTAKSFEGKPVLFVGVNSGNDRGTVENYVRQHQIGWPVIVDEDRSFEKQSGVGEISLMNIYQSGVLGGDGEFMRTGFDLQQSGERAAASGKWRIDPSAIPPALKSTWQQIEFGQFAAAAPLIKKGLATQNAEVKAGAEKLNSAVLADLNKTLEAAKKSNDTGSKWAAYKGFASIQTKFKGYEIPAEVPDAVKELAASDDVKKELAASKVFDTIQKAAAKAYTPSQQKSVKGQLERLVKQYPGTEAAQDAAKMLTE